MESGATLRTMATTAECLATPLPRCERGLELIPCLLVDATRGGGTLSP